MSSNGSEPRIELTLRPRREWFWGLLGIHALAFVALWAAGFSLLAQLLLMAATASSLWRQLAVHWRRSAPRAIRSIIWHPDGRWELADNRGTTVGVLADHYLGTRLVILKFQRHPAVLLWRGGAMSPALRRLRVRLRHGRVHGQDQSPEAFKRPSRAGV